MPETNLFAVSWIVHPSCPFGPLSLFHLVSRLLTNSVFDEGSARHGKSAGEHALEVMRRRCDMRLVVPKEHRRQRDRVCCVYIGKLERQL